MLIEIETSNLLYIDFKKMVIRMLKELRDHSKELSGNYNSMKMETGYNISNKKCTRKNYNQIG